MDEPRRETCDECGGPVEWSAPSRPDELVNPLDLGCCQRCGKRFYAPA